MKAQIMITFVDENGASYARKLSELYEGQQIKGTMRFPLKITSFIVHIEAINEEGKLVKPETHE